LSGSAAPVDDDDDAAAADDDVDDDDDDDDVSVVSHYVMLSVLSTVCASDELSCVIMILYALTLCNLMCVLMMPQSLSRAVVCTFPTLDLPRAARPCD